MQAALARRYFRHSYTDTHCEGGPGQASLCAIRALTRARSGRSRAARSLLELLYPALSRVAGGRVLQHQLRDRGRHEGREDRPAGLGLRPAGRGHAPVGIHLGICRYLHTADIDIAISIISISSISISTSGSDFSGSDGDPFRTGPLDYSL